MPAQPNIVIVMTDQQRADLSAREGFPLDTTPFLDSLARRGTWFDRAYTPIPACGPARVSMLTGRYPSATRVRTNHNIPDAVYTEDLFSLFRARGYNTALVGKNHSHILREDVDYFYGANHLNADDDDNSPETRAFAGFMRDTHFHLATEATPFPLEVQFPYRVVSKAQEWITSLEAADGKTQPFLLWLSFAEPHNPYQIPEPYYSLFPPEVLPPNDSDETALATKGFKYQWCRDSFIKAFPDFVETMPRARANYLGMLRLIDDQVRRFVDFLDAENLSDDTILIFMSDHGDFVGEYGLMRKGPDLPESLTRVPLSFTGPGILAGEEAHPAHVSIVDLLPTLCEAAGIALPEGVQGRSFWPLLTGQPYPEGEFASAYMEHGFGGLYYTAHEDLDPSDDGLTASPDGVSWGAYDCLNSWTQSGQMRAIRKGDWKLTYDMQGNGQLYHLPEDPSEVNDLYDRPETAQIQAELMADLMTWILRTQDPLPLPRHRYVPKTDPRNYWTPYRT